jgi:nucleoid-associated protein YgaU
MIRAATRLTLIASVFLLSSCALWRDEARHAPLPRMMASAVVMPALPPAPPARHAYAAPERIGQPQDFVCYDGAVMRVTPSETGDAVRVSVNGAAPMTLNRADEDGLMAYRANGVVLRRAGPRVSLAGDAASVVVQPGDTLGLIARRLYGDRTRAAEIAAANSDTIANPDLIYPGQTLRLPAVERRCRRGAGADRATLTPVSASGG